jgi:hypothetical protein
MSTNYYVRTPATAPDAEGIHLGKWANGEFHFRAYPDAADRPAEVTWDVTDIDSWTRLLDLGDVVTEYGRPITAAEMVAEAQREPRSWRPAIEGGQYTDSRGNRFSPYEFC